jgi:predicted metalloendopeptidase
MTNVNTDGLPPEMQARIAEIIEKAKSQAPAPQQPQQQAPIQRPPTLMDHTVALRQEVAALRQELHAVAQVTDAVGQAVGQLYQTFLGESEFTDQGPTYQPEAPVNEDY